MKDFDLNINYGIYENSQISDALALANVIRFMAELIEKRISLGNRQHIVNLGSGEGKTAHYLALNYGCQVTCVNNYSEQNNRNYQQAQQLGIGHLIKIFECSFEELPLDWEQHFDIVWSQETFYQAQNKYKVIQNSKTRGNLCFHRYYVKITLYC